MPQLDVFKEPLSPIRRVLILHALCYHESPNPHEDRDGRILRGEIEIGRGSHGVTQTQLRTAGVVSAPDNPEEVWRELGLNLPPRLDAELAQNRFGDASFGVQRRGFDLEA